MSEVKNEKGKTKIKLTKEEREILKKLISDIQRPKHWREKRLLG